jgi:hypothetical protein
MELVSYCSSQVSELCHIFESFISYIYIMILSFSLVTRRVSLLSFKN